MAARVAYLLLSAAGSCRQDIRWCSAANTQQGDDALQQHGLHWRVQIHHGRSVTMADRVCESPTLTRSEIGCFAWSLTEDMFYSSALARPVCSHTHCSGTHHCFLL